MNALAQDVRFAIRTLWKTPAFTAIALLALALGIGANSAIFTVVNSVLLHPLPFPHPEQICQIYTARFGDSVAMDDRSFVEFEKQSAAFENLSAISGGASSLTGFGEPIPVHGQAVTTGFWPALGVNASLGRTFRKGDDLESVAVLSDKLWRTHFNADQSILGKIVKLDGTPRTILGVMSAGFAFPADAEVWTPLVVNPQPGAGWAYSPLSADSTRVFPSIRRARKPKPSHSDYNLRNRTRRKARALCRCTNPWWGKSGLRSMCCSAPSVSFC
jgi:putative ABC transport system permease protein